MLQLGILQLIKREPVVVKASTCALTVNKVLHRVHYNALTAYSVKKLKPAVMYRSCKMKWNHILFLWFRFASTHLMGSHEIHSTKKKRETGEVPFRSIVGKIPPQDKTVFTLDIIQRAVTL